MKIRWPGILSFLGVIAVVAFLALAFGTLRSVFEIGSIPQIADSANSPTEAEKSRLATNVSSEPEILYLRGIFDIGNPSDSGGYLALQENDCEGVFIALGEPVTSKWVLEGIRSNQVLLVSSESELLLDVTLCEEHDLIVSKTPYEVRVSQVLKKMESEAMSLQTALAYDAAYDDAGNFAGLKLKQSAGMRKYQTALGLQMRDVIQAVDGIPLTSLGQATSVLNAYSAYDNFSMTIVRKGQELKVEIGQNH